ncbi:MAG: hypothetical protein MMC33_008840 [Icmadophila ericetorum]|nr:hypothetical protein [Icmadophila ericetorum]
MVPPDSKSAYPRAIHSSRGYKSSRNPSQQRIVVYLNDPERPWSPEDLPTPSIEALNHPPNQILTKQRKSKEPYSTKKKKKVAAVRKIGACRKCKKGHRECTHVLSADLDMETEQAQRIETVNSGSSLAVSSTECLTSGSDPCQTGPLRQPHLPNFVAKGGLPLQQPRQRARVHRSRKDPRSIPLMRQEALYHSQREQVQPSATGSPTFEEIRSPSYFNVYSPQSGYAHSSGDRSPNPSGFIESQTYRLPTSSYLHDSTLHSEQLQAVPPGPNSLSRPSALPVAYEEPSSHLYWTGTISEYTIRSGQQQSPVETGSLDEIDRYNDELGATEVQNHNAPGYQGWQWQSQLHQQMSEANSLNDLVSDSGDKSYVYSNYESSILPAFPLEERAPWDGDGGWNEGSIASGEDYGTDFVEGDGTWGGDESVHEESWKGQD